MNNKEQDYKFKSERFNQLAEKLKNEEELSFDDQCVLFMAVISRPGARITKEMIGPVMGNTVIWDKLQDMFQVIYENAEGHDALSWKSQLFGDEFKKQCKKESEAARERINSMTCTYIIRKQGSSQVKIGKSLQVYERIKTLRNQSGCDMEILCIIERNVEAMLHKQFDEFRTIGEWFDDSKGLIAAFAAKQGVAA